MLSRQGFTLIELSIVLVVIGLVVGGVLVGRDMISSAELRAQITQIEKFNQAANTFYVKYGSLPGDIPANAALQFGLAARGPYNGEGDGNGRLFGILSHSALGECGAICVSAGETALFWVDLSTAGLIEGNFNTATATSVPSSVPATGYSLYMPEAKIARNYIYVVHDSVKNIYAMSRVTSLSNIITPGTGINARQAYYIDNKMDDGFPQTGIVLAQYNVTGGFSWVRGGGGYNVGANPGVATPAGATTCYDNGGNASAPMMYSVNYANGTTVNCTLTFKLTAG